MPVRIVTDSTSDLTGEIAKGLGITVVPLNVHFGTESYRDGIDLTTEDFYHKLAQSVTLPTTSSPSPGDFAAVFDRLAEETDEILAITISSKLSATYQVATQAMELRKSKARLEIIDSLSAIAGLGLITISAARAAKAGCRLDEVIDVTRSSMIRVDFRIAFDTLEYLRKGGRIGTAQAFLGSVLNMNPILTIKNGIIEGITRARSRIKALAYLRDFAAGFPEIEELSVEDATTPGEAETLIEQLGEFFPMDRIHRMKVSPVIGTHVGPHIIGVGVLPKG